MEYYESTYTCAPHLSHHGIQGMRWGIRKYQNSDGSLTPEGRIRYGRSSGKMRSQASEPSKSKSSKAKKALIVGAAVVGTGLLAYGAYKTGVLDNVLSKGSYTSRVTSIPGLQDMFKQNLSDLSGSSDTGRKARSTADDALNELRKQSERLRRQTGR